MTRSDNFEQLLKFSSIRNGMKKLEEATEFYFTSSSRNDANNIAIELYKLGYHVYQVLSPDVTGCYWLVTGWTKYMPVEETKLRDWLVRMHELANRHNATFESFGFLVECKDPTRIDRQVKKLIRKVIKKSGR